MKQSQGDSPVTGRSRVRRVRSASVAKTLAGLLRSVHGEFHHPGRLPLEKRGLICGVRLDGVIYALVWRRAASLKHPMTPREREVACLVAAGNPNKAIAQALRLQPATVAACLRGIFRKLDIRRRAELARDFLLLE